LAVALETWDTKICRLRACAGNVNMPHNYKLNNG
jgi:hypothetical protein